MLATFLIQAAIAGIMSPSPVYGAAGTMALVAGAPAGVDGVTLSAAEPPAPGRIAEWAVSSRDNGGAPFLVVDRAYSQLYAFDSSGALQGIADVRTGGDGNAGPAGRRGAQRSGNTRHDQVFFTGRLVMKGRRNERGEVVLHAAEAPASYGRSSSSSAAASVSRDASAEYDTISFPAGRPNRAVEKLVAGKRVLVYVIPEIPPLAGLQSHDFQRFPAEQRQLR